VCMHVCVCVGAIVSCSRPLPCVVEGCYRNALSIVISLHVLETKNDKYHILAHKKC